MGTAATVVRENRHASDAGNMLWTSCVSVGTHVLSHAKTIPAGGLQAGWRIVARRGWRCGWLAARGKV